MNKNYILFGIVVVIVVPMFIGLLVMIPGSVTSDNDWISFWGSYAGGIITLFGVWLSIQFYKNQDKKRKDDFDNHHLKLLYWHLKMQIDKISELYNQVVLFEALYVPPSEIFTKSDYDYYFDKLAYVDKIFNNDEVKRLNLYYKELFDLETIRCEYHRIKESRDKDTAGYVIEKEKSFKGFKNHLISVANLHEGEGYYMGLIPTPCNVFGLIEKLEDHLGIQGEPKPDPLSGVLEEVDARLNEYNS